MKEVAFLKQRFVSLCLFFVLCIIPNKCFAHVKWFTHTQPHKESIENILSPLFMFTAIFVAILLAILPQIVPMLSKLSILKNIDKRLDEFRKYSFFILKYGTAIALIIQVFGNTIFAPEFFITNTWEKWLIIVTIVFLFIPHHFATKIGAFILLGIFIYTTVHVGLFHMLDYGFYLAIIGVLLIGNTKYKDWGFPFLYLGTGLSLCWVAVEKWVYPNMSIDIIHHHHVPTFGFTPETFVVLAAFIEFVVGYLLVVGILNRLLAFVLTLIFISTTMLFGHIEVMGHFMVHVILLIFIIEGVSFYHPPIKIHKTILDQMVFVFLNFIFTLSTFILIYYRFG